MADIIFRYEEMNAAASRIEAISESYRAAGETLINELLTAIEPWEGESKNRFLQLIEGDVQAYLITAVPQTVLSLSQMLKSNSDQMLNADQTLSQNIPVNI